MSGTRNAGVLEFAPTPQPVSSQNCSVLKKRATGSINDTDVAAHIVIYQNNTKDQLFPQHPLHERSCQLT